MKIKLTNLAKHYGEVKAVDDFTATIEEGKLMALLGPSGCGKSTLLYLLAGTVPATNGTIHFDDEDVTYMSPEKRGVGLVFQNYALYPHMTVLQNICFPLDIQKVPKDEKLKRAMEMAKLVHIEEYLDRKPAELSGGQQQRVAIARALVKRPRLLLLDEPLSNLDARLRLEMREEIRRIQQETKVTTIFVTHDQEEAMSISDTILLMKDGRKQQYASPKELYEEPANSFVADFLGNPPINTVTGIIKDGKFVVDDGDGVCTWEKCKLVPEGKKVILAVRAESIVVANSKKDMVFEGVIEHKYSMGKEELSYILLGNAQIRGYIPSELGYEVKDKIKIGFRSKGVFLFDATTGKRYK